MGWEFAAVWIDEPDRAWKWIWRRVADDSGAVLEQSRDFAHLRDCIVDAKLKGFDDSGCDTV
jgi:hypothetical protein